MGKLVAILLLFISISLTPKRSSWGKLLPTPANRLTGTHLLHRERKRHYHRLPGSLPVGMSYSLYIGIFTLNYKKETYKLNKSDAPFVITLRNKQNNLKEVVVTALPASGRILSSIKGIERIPAILGEQDVLKYLATIPGIVTTNALNSGIYVRGGNSNENGFLINNMPIAYPDHLTGILSTFDPYILNNSTLFKSGFPARYNSFYPPTLICVLSRETSMNTKES